MSVDLFLLMIGFIILPEAPEEIPIKFVLDVFCCRL